MTQSGEFKSRSPTIHRVRRLARRLTPVTVTSGCCNAVDGIESQMADAIKMGTILIREGTLLPVGVPVESDVFLPGWRLVKNLEGDGLDQKFHGAGCTFFSVAGEIGATVFGLDEQKTLRRAIEQILAKRGPAEFNSVEIMRVAWETSKRFLGVSCVTVSAQSRDIQEGAALSRAKDLPVKERARLAAA